MITSESRFSSYILFHTGEPQSTVVTKRIHRSKSCVTTLITWTNSDQIGPFIFYVWNTVLIYPNTRGSLRPSANRNTTSDILRRWGPYTKAPLSQSDPLDSPLILLGAVTLPRILWWLLIGCVNNLSRGHFLSSSGHFSGIQRPLKFISFIYTHL